MEVAIHGWRYKDALDEVWNVCFRPLFKHGYSNRELAELCEKSDDVCRAIEILSEIFQDCKRDSE
jgi:hypothetical protein